VIGFFKQKAPGNVAILFIFGLLIKLHLFFDPKPAIVDNNTGELYQALVRFLSSANPVFTSALAYALVYVQSMQLTYLINNYRMTTRSTYLPAMAYLLITSFLPEWNYLSPALVCNTFIIMAFVQLFQLYHQPSANSRIFNIGLMIGLASFIFFPVVLFAIAILIGLLILRPFRFKELMLLLMGILPPFYFYAVYLYLANKLTTQAWIPHVNFNIPDMDQSLWRMGSIVLIGIPFVAGGYYIQSHLRKMLIQARKNWSILLIYLLVAFLVPFTSQAKGFDNWIMALPPFAAFHACAFLFPPRKWLSTLLFFAMLVFIFAWQWFAYGYIFG
jgi:hypothetical protein